MKGQDAASLSNSFVDMRVSFDANRPPAGGVPDAVVTQLVQAMVEDGGEGSGARSSLRREPESAHMSAEPLLMSPTSDEPPPTYSELIASGSVGHGGATSIGVARLAYACPKTPLHPLPHAFIIGLKRRLGYRVSRPPILSQHEGPVDPSPDIWIGKPLRTQFMVNRGLCGSEFWLRSI